MYNLLVAHTVPRASENNIRFRNYRNAEFIMIAEGKQRLSMSNRNYLSNQTTFVNSALNDTVEPLSIFTEVEVALAVAITTTKMGSRNYVVRSLSGNGALCFSFGTTVGDFFYLCPLKGVIDMPVGGFFFSWVTSDSCFQSIECQSHVGVVSATEMNFTKLTYSNTLCIIKYNE
jgi:hypothetical protein